MEKYLISVDWLEVFGYSKTGKLFAPESYVPQGDYYLIDSGVMSRGFEHVIEVRKRFGVQTYLPVATIRCVPRSSALNKRLCLIKLNNRVLYSQGYVDMLFSILDRYEIGYKGLSRIDLCYDCNKFSGGRSPLRFMKQFAFVDQQSKKYIYKVGGSKSFRIFASKNPTSFTSISGLEFGSGKSCKRAYMYDKSRELKEVKDKPWIREAWEQAGLINDEKTHVYRSEISIKTEGTELMNKVTGEVFRLNPKWLVMQRNIEYMFHTYADNLFDFRLKGKAKRLREYKKIQLFERSEDVCCVPKRVNLHADTGRTEKVVTNTLLRYMHKYSDASEGLRNGIYSAIKFLNEVSGLKMRSVEVADKIRYLEAFKGYRFTAQEELDYLQFVAVLGQVRYDLTYWQSPHYIYAEDWAMVPDDSLQLYYEYLESLEEKTL